MTNFIIMELIVIFALSTLYYFIKELRREAKKNKEFN